MSDFLTCPKCGSSMIYSYTSPASDFLHYRCVSAACDGVADLPPWAFDGVIDDPNFDREPTDEERECPYCGGTGDEPLDDSGDECPHCAGFGLKPEYW